MICCQLSVVGKLVGYPTNGSVISTGGKQLVDGSFVRLPGRGWFVKATYKNEELGPAVPDIIVYKTHPIGLRAVLMNG